MTTWEVFSYGDKPFPRKKGAEIIEILERGERLAKPLAAPDVSFLVRGALGGWRNARKCDRSSGVTYISLFHLPFLSGCTN